MHCQILDINIAKVSKGEKYFIDTNVWYWVAYAASKTSSLPNPPKTYQINEYSKFMQSALDDKATLCHCPLVFTELANVIEKAELEIYQAEIYKERKKCVTVTRKEFRKIEAKRKEVIDEINDAWKIVKSMSACVDVKLTSAFTDKAAQLLADGLIDSFDAFYIQMMQEAKIDYIVTDDGDFKSMKNIKNLMVLTANPQVLGLKGS